MHNTHQVLKDTTGALWQFLRAGEWEDYTQLKAAIDSYDHLHKAHRLLEAAHISLPVNLSSQPTATQSPLWPHRGRSKTNTPK